MMTINNQIFSDYFTGHLNQTVEAPRAHICGCRHPHSRRRPPSRSGSRFFGCLNLEHVVFFGKTLGAVFSCPSCFFLGGYTCWIGGSWWECENVGRLCRLEVSSFSAGQKPLKKCQPNKQHHLIRLQQLWCMFRLELSWKHEDLLGYVETLTTSRCFFCATVSMTWRNK